jgi:phospholipid/cholesterol/gamma-HCH transport system permease protein
MPSNTIDVVIRTDREGVGARVVPAGAFDLAHARDVRQAAESVERRLAGCRTIDVDLTQLDSIDGSGAVLLARLFDVLDTTGCRTTVAADGNPEAARLIALYRGGAATSPVAATPAMNVLERLGLSAAALPVTVNRAFDFTGHCMAAFSRAIVSPRSIDWDSLPRLIQAIGADALLVTGAANLLVGLIIGFLGVSQLGRFGAVVYVPELVVVAHFRELGPLVTAIVVAGRSGAGLASEIATMQVSEEIDALRSMGFDPVSWLVVPRCLALVVTMPILTWIGDVLALAGGLVATVAITDMTPRAFVIGTSDAITAAHFLGGLIKSPFLALAIGLIACGQGRLPSALARPLPSCSPSSA